MNNKPTLNELQQWLLTITSHPGGLTAGIHAAQQAIGLSNNQLNQVVQSDYGIAPQRRLAIYHQGYFARLLQCMRAEYPRLIKAFSQAWFDQMALHYLSQTPPNSTSLNELGKYFPAFIAADRPDKDNEEKTPAYAFIETLATFERAWVEISRGPGTEAVDFSQFDCLEQQIPETLNITLAPSLRLLKSPFDLYEYLQPSPSMEVPVMPAAGCQYLAICRKDFHLITYLITDWQYHFLQQLNDESCVTKALASLHTIDSQENILARLPVWLTLCAERGFFQQVAYEQNIK